MILLNSLAAGHPVSLIQAAAQGFTVFPHKLTGLGFCLLRSD